MECAIEQIKKKFDAIVDFSGLADFIDTPVKRYSSGMYARLGFSVAAHVDPEILLVDEVLSVGDYAFQNKCMEKMNSILERWLDCHICFSQSKGCYAAMPTLYSAGSWQDNKRRTGKRRSRLLFESCAGSRRITWDERGLHFSRDS